MMSEELYKPSRARLFLIMGGVLAIVAIIVGVIAALVVYIIIPLVRESGKATRPDAPRPVAVATFQSIDRPDLPPPTAIYPPKREGLIEVRLPATPTAVAVGGAGRWLVIHFPRLQTVGLFDCCQVRFRQFFPASDPDTLVAAGADAFFVYQPQNEQLERWNFRTYQRELQKNPRFGKDVEQLVMGSASHGPLVVVHRNMPNPRGVAFYDGQSLEPLDFAPEGVFFSELNRRAQVSVAADGLTITKVESVMPSPFPAAALRLLPPAQMGPDLIESTTVSRALVPSFDGGMLLGSSIYDYDLASIPPPPDAARDQLFLPALHAPYFVGIRTNGTTQANMTIYDGESFKPLHTLNDVDVGDLTKSRRQVELSPAQRVFLSPRANRLMVLLPELDRLDLHPLDVERDRELAGLPALRFPVTVPPPVIAGEPWTAVLDSPQPLKQLELRRGPKAFVIFGEGTMMFPVVEDIRQQREFEIVLYVQDQRGQERMLGFDIPVQNPQLPEYEAIPSMPHSLPVE